jgi:hypothetical protein
MRAGIVASWVVMVFLLSPPRAMAAGDLDCQDFGTREAAEHALDRSDGVDSNGLDRDRDGDPCERLPSAVWYAGVAGLTAAFVTILAVLRIYEARWPEGDDWWELLFGPFLVAIPGYLLPWFLKWVLPRSTPAIVYGFIGAGVSVVVVLAVKAREGVLRRPPLSD